MRLIITEKPSVARDLGRVLGVQHKGKGCLEGNGMCISWCIGHLLELEDPAHYNPQWKSWSLDTLPMVPEAFSLRPRKGAEDQWKIVRDLLRSSRFDSVVNACDAGREGELIFRYVYQFSKSRLPVKRLWVSSLTDQAIREGWSRLQKGERFDALAAAARSRSEADWLVGLNITRAMTCRTRQEGGDALWSVGRVQTPTLAMIVARDREIQAFVPETYWQVKGTFQSEDTTWTGTWFAQGSSDRGAKKSDGSEEVPKGQRFSDQASAEAVAEASAGQPGEIVKASRREREEKPPLLYDLTALQRRANKRYGLSAQRTLEVAQALYERHKLITYPRTDARFLTSDQVQTLPGILRAVSSVSVYAPFAEQLLSAPLRTGSRVVNDAEVGDHHAILPTDRPVQGARLQPDEKRIYDLVARRFMAALSENAIIANSELVVAVSPKPEVVLPAGITGPLTYRSKGRVIVRQGWRAVDPPSKRSDRVLPMVEEGTTVHTQSAEVKEGQTKPPKPYDDASLLAAMETAGRTLEDRELKRAMRNAGLGTPATRAAILQTLLDRKYIARRGRALIALDKGFALIAALPVEDLTSAILTGRWEKRLAEIAEGSESRSAFMGDVVRRLEEMVVSIRGASMPAEATVRTRPLEKELGSCPVCQAPVRRRGPVWTCDTGRSCSFVIFSTVAKRKVSERMVRQLLKDGKTPLLKGFKSKAGKAFEAGLRFNEEGKVVFWFEDERPRSAGSTPQPTSQPQGKGPEGQSCPQCNEGRILRGRTAWGCSRWREGCDWRLSFSDEGGEARTAKQAVEAVARLRQGAAPQG